jgi:hypothetical protein
MLTFQVVGPKFADSKFADFIKECFAYQELFCKAQICFQAQKALTQRWNH